MGVIIQPKDMLEGTIHETKSFGKLVITKYVNAKEVWFKFLGTGYESYTRTWLIRKGSVKDMLYPSVCGVGFIGDGIYTAYINTRTPSRAYRAWHAMINRCYNPTLIRAHPTYQDCTVCDEWFNFQTFAKWYYLNHPEQDKTMDLDKDIKVDGNRVYSPGACMIVSRFDNSKKANEKRQRPFKVVNPGGVEFNGLCQSDFCSEHDLSISGLSTLINGKIKAHKGWTLAK